MANTFFFINSTYNRSEYDKPLEWFDALFRSCTWLLPINCPEMNMNWMIKSFILAGSLPLYHGQPKRRATSPKPLKCRALKTTKKFNEAKLPLTKPRYYCSDVKRWTFYGVEHYIIMLLLWHTFQQLWNWSDTHFANHNSHKFRCHLCLQVIRIFTSPWRFLSYFWRT